MNDTARQQNDLEEQNNFIKSPKSINQDEDEDEVEDKASAISTSTKILAALGYGISSILIQVSLKVTLTVFKFPSALFIAFFQAVFTVVALIVLKSMKYIDYPTPSFDNLKMVQPLPVIQLINVATSLVGTKALSIPMFTVLRRFSIPLTMVGETIILRSRPDTKVKMTVALIMSGSVIAAIFDLSFDLWGYGACFASALATAMYAITSKSLLTGTNKRTKWELLFYNSAVSIPLYPIILYNSGTAHTNEVFEYDYNNILFIFMFFCSITMGFLLNFAILNNTQVNGALSTTIFGCLKNVLMTYLGILGLGGDYSFSFHNFVGINISMIGALIYSYVTFKKK